MGSPQDRARPRGAAPLLLRRPHLRQGGPVPLVRVPAQPLWQAAVKGAIALSARNPSGTHRVESAAPARRRRSGAPARAGQLSPQPGGARARHAHTRAPGVGRRRLPSSHPGAARHLRRGRGGVQRRRREPAQAHGALPRGRPEGHRRPLRRAPRRRLREPQYPVTHSIGAAPRQLEAVAHAAPLLARPLDELNNRLRHVGQEAVPI